MKKNYLFLGIIGLVLISSGCSNRQSYPVNPKNGDNYVDDQGNNCTYNAALNYWIISSIMNGRRVNSYYYPSTGSYRNVSGSEISRPASYSHSSESGGYHSGGFGSTGHGVSCGE
jgi:hypothetical protein